MWTQTLNVVLGLWLMASPALLGYGRPAATMAHIVGPLIVTFACIALWEATRAVRWINVPWGLALAVAPWVLGYPAVAGVNSAAVGAAVALLACVRGKTTHNFDGGWSMLWRRRTQLAADCQ